MGTICTATQFDGDQYYENKFRKDTRTINKEMEKLTNKEFEEALQDYTNNPSKSKKIYVTKRESNNIKINKMQMNVDDAVKNENPTLAELKNFKKQRKIDKSSNDYGNTYKKLSNSYSNSKFKSNHLKILKQFSKKQSNLSFSKKDMKNNQNNGVKFTILLTDTNESLTICKLSQKSKSKKYMGSPNNEKIVESNIHIVNDKQEGQI